MKQCPWGGFGSTLPIGWLAWPQRFIGALVETKFQMQQNGEVRKRGRLLYLVLFVTLGHLGELSGGHPAILAILGHLSTSDHI